MDETKVNPYDPSTNGTNGAYVPPSNPAYDPSTNGTNGAYVPPSNPAYDPSTNGTNGAYVPPSNPAYDPSTNGTNGAYVPPSNPAYDPSTNVAYGNAAYGNAAYNNAAYPAGPTAPMDGSAPPAYNPAPMVQPMTVGVPVTTMITRQGHAPPRPQTFIIHNVLMLLFCCCIFGIIGVFKGSQVDSFYNQGNYDAANAASLSAKRWFNSGLICGGVVYVILLITWTIILLSLS